MSIKTKKMPHLDNPRVLKRCDKGRWKGLYLLHTRQQHAGDTRQLSDRYIEGSKEISCVCKIYVGYMAMLMI